MEEKDKGARARVVAIKIDEGFPRISQHTLDLKKRNNKQSAHNESAPFFSIPKIIKRSGFKEALGKLLVASILRAIVFLPKRIPGCLCGIFRSAGRRICARVKKSAALLKERIGLQSHRAEKHSFKLDFSPPQHWQKALVSFAVLAFVFVLPLKAFSSFEELESQKDEVVEYGLAAYESLRNSDFISASVSFASAKKTINDLGLIFKYFVSVLPGVGDKINFGNALLIVGENFSNAASLLQNASEYFDNDIAMVEKIKYLQAKVNEATPSLLIANKVLGNLDNNFEILPVDINPFKRLLQESTKALLVFQDFSKTLLDMLGDTQFKRYLVVFQNNNEIRPTGGFIGSFAILDVDRGVIKNIEIPGGGSYDIQGQLKELVISPEPFHLINSTWQFQDSNWFPDFPETAKKIMWFYEKSGGSSVDGVVAINATLMEELLGLIGPIEMPEYGRVMTAENFIEETQKIVELEYDKEMNKPKQIIADMAPKILDILLKMDAKYFSGFSKIMHKAILEKDIMAYSKDEETEAKLGGFGLSGGLRDISEFSDYLMVIDTNIAGQKTDGKIVKNIEHFSEIDGEGSIINTVSVTRRHTGTKGTLFSGVRNVNYLRLYVPLGSELISASGFKAPPGELFESPPDGYVLDKDLQRVQGIVHVDPASGTRLNNEFGRTVFGNWIMVDPGQEVTVTFKYRLPYKIGISRENTWASDVEEKFDLQNKFFSYKMLIEKQPGAKNTFIKSSAAIKGKNIVARVGDGVALQANGWQYETALDGDKYFGVVLEE